jgi:3-deoxy-D-manno-octulosonic-acid transferase
MSHKNLKVSGNLKYGKPHFPLISALAESSLESFLKFDIQKKTIVIACTHDSEELVILKALQDKLSKFNVVIIPRHPQRFKSVYETLKNAGFQVASYSEGRSFLNDIFLIDAIGLMSLIYKKADAVILGGSFIKKIGGHNLLEPVYCGSPVIVGPYMNAQSGLVSLLDFYRLGKQTSIDNLSESLEDLLKKTFYKTNVRNFISLNQDPATKLLKNVIADFNL